MIYEQKHMVAISNYAILVRFFFITIFFFFFNYYRKATNHFINNNTHSIVGSELYIQVYLNEPFNFIHFDEVNLNRLRLCFLVCYQRAFIQPGKKTRTFFIPVLECIQFFIKSVNSGTNMLCAYLTGIICTAYGIY